MNRTIKFRGLRVDGQGWVYGYYVETPFEGTSRIYYQPFSEASANTYHIVRKDSVGQFTGLLDKNGKEIYEGDTLECETDSDPVFKSDKIKLNVSFEINGWSLKSRAGLISLYHNRFAAIEVIGNIHEKESNTQVTTQSNGTTEEH